MPFIKKIIVRADAELRSVRKFNLLLRFLIGRVENWRIFLNFIYFDEREVLRLERSSAIVRRL